MSEKKKLVMLVDDNLKLMKFVEVQLKLHGFEVTTISSGQSALEAARSDTPDVMILDLRMPEMDGFEVLDRLRKFSDVPVIAYSATPEYSKLAIKAGATVFVEKPFNVDEFVELVVKMSRCHS